MAKVHVNVGPADASDTKTVFQNPGQHPLPPGAGQPLSTQASGKGQVNSGQVNSSGSIPGLVFNNPASSRGTCSPQGNFSGKPATRTFRLFLELKSAQGESAR